MRKINKQEMIRVLTIAFNRGYMAGHHDTVEGTYVDVHRTELDTRHESEALDIVQEFLFDDE